MSVTIPYSLGVKESPSRTDRFAGLVITGMPMVFSLCFTSSLFTYFSIVGHNVTHVLNLLQFLQDSGCLSFIRFSPFEVAEGHGFILPGNDIRTCADVPALGKYHFDRTLDLSPV